MTPSLPGDFRPLADLLPQPLLLLTVDGSVAAANRAAAALLGRPEAELQNRHLSVFCEGDDQAITALIRASARSSSPAPGTLTLLLADGRALSCRCEGALFRQRRDDAPALVLLQLIRKDEAIARFSLLNQKIDGLSREVARRLASEQQLRTTTERLEQADRSKNEFLSMLAHELRNPLAPLRMGIQLLERKHGALPDVGPLTAMMARQTDHMVRLIDDLLDVARLTHGTIEFRQDRFALVDAIEQAVEMQRPVIEAKGLTLNVESGSGQPAMFGDSTRIVQVFANLLANAAKFTDSGGRIDVRIGCENYEAVVSVQDTGVGIPAALLPNVFDLFVQGERSLDRQQGGLGVGLTIVRTIVQHHGGSVQATSTGDNCGSQFVVRLPLASQPQPASERERAPIAATAGALRVLVVDDNVDAAHALSSLVESWGHQIECVHNGHEALTSIRGVSPDALLLDIGLPGMDGYELARTVRQLPQTASALIVAVTGYGDAESRQRSAEAGFDHHLTKPIDLGTLEQLLARHQPWRLKQPEN